jgi:hypothetical protein
MLYIMYRKALKCTNNAKNAKLEKHSIEREILYIFSSSHISTIVIIFFSFLSFLFYVGGPQISSANRKSAKLRTN